MDLTAYYQTVITVLMGLIGLCVGSFLNVVIYRLPNKMSLSYPPSHCPNCDYQLRWYDNVPIFSYLFLGGKCRKCRKPISPRYLLIEVANMVLWLLCRFTFGTGNLREALMTVSAAFAASVCLCVAAIDWEHHIIFDRFQIMMAAAGVLFAAAESKTVPEFLLHLAAGAVASAVFFGIGAVVSKAVGQEALGGGDIKFVFGAGVFLGFGRMLLMILLASLVACAVIGIAAAACKTKNAADDETKKEYPFGPFLAGGFLVALLFGNPILGAYLSLF